MAAFEGSSATLVDRIQGVLGAERHRLRDELLDRAAEREFAPQDPNGPAANGGAAAVADGGGGKGVGDFQRKITPDALLAASAAGRRGDAAGGGLTEGAGAGGRAAILKSDKDEEPPVSSARTQRLSPV
ncbi:hypothetical protein GPECTOR_12g435 [Gonium pectorale]|uniref:Uncharacterized protein n=1 Tax=Gonium pectorale TaxID=33097 RepID=A0A150GP03_GONPE|nr:hypothetical protein GPECTOR_12g435 [Gonium pectorale]|eukprot:KXZ51472.1 hypothetical protein GPECTOR_12g435 [Gonium pectorale]